MFMVLPRVFFVRSPLVCFGFFRRLCCLFLGFSSGAFSRCCFCVFFEVKEACASGAGDGECGGGAYGFGALGFAGGVIGWIGDPGFCYPFFGFDLRSVLGFGVCLMRFDFCWIAVFKNSF